MTTNSETKSFARIVGALFIVQMVMAIISLSVLLEPLIHAEDFLVELSANATKVKLAMLFDLVCGASLVAIAVLLFPS